ncbi:MULTISPECIES: YopX family protein [unclassified Neptuniibacter]|uniref:YopX family protein n=1 Tax=unclassified Neptuniibacter TaxID=2630693 RepID=UPI000C543496|nr:MULTISPECIES: YopX family protein [unclassified Neptuniibacter]MAY41695.1 hypothetical protein [Oceanospirillaceae bacterium]|tara:strand:- start:4132 stop:4545 length:414 start_codon:yes stop_codon:yes gene_type:complete
MEREIKFRAWDHDLKRMLVVGDMPDLVIGFDGHIYDKGCKFTSQISTVSSGISLMQYTGLKDKNGAEIYEGDIVLWHFEDGSITSVVKWDDQYKPMYLLELQPPHGPVSYEMINCRCGVYEVIGNIHENPELLEVKL